MFIAVLLVLVILAQNSKGGGLASGLSASNQIMGVRKTTDFLEKLTWGFAIALFALALLGNFVIPKNQVGKKESLIQNQIDNTAAPQTTAPQSPVPPPAKK